MVNKQAKNIVWEFLVAGSDDQRIADGQLAMRMC